MVNCQWSIVNCQCRGTSAFIDNWTLNIGHWPLFTSQLPGPFAACAAAGFSATAGSLEPASTGTSPVHGCFVFGCAGDYATGVVVCQTPAGAANLAIRRRRATILIRCATMNPSSDRTTPLPLNLIRQRLPARFPVNRAFFCPRACAKLPTFPQGWQLCR
jgi:hypothetical protein